MTGAYTVRDPQSPSGVPPDTILDTTMTSLAASLDAPSKTAATINDYDAIAEQFDIGNRDHDVSQNLDALLGPLAWGLKASGLFSEKEMAALDADDP